MIIRETSMDAFKQMAIAAFEDEMIKHCRVFSPTICKPLGKEVLRLAIRQSLTQAEARGFTRRGSSQFYLECMLIFGSGFATDPQYPWIAAVLSRNDFEQELHKAEELYEVVKKHLDEVAGTDSRYVRGCLRRLLRLLAQELPVQQESFAPDMLNIFAELHAEKVDAAGPLAVAEVVRHAAERGRNEWGLTGTRSVAVLAILMWFSGIRCDEDPFLPWIRESLTHTPHNTAANGVLLEKRAVDFFEAFLRDLV